MNLSLEKVNAHEFLFLYIYIYIVWELIDLLELHALYHWYLVRTLGVL